LATLNPCGRGVRGGSEGGKRGVRGGSEGGQSGRRGLEVLVRSEGRVGSKGAGVYNS